MSQTDADELKSGRRHSEADMTLGRKLKAMAGEIATGMDALGFIDPPAPAEWTPTDTEKALVFMGGAVKALGDGRVGGYLVRFSTASDPDLYGDFFTAETDFGEHDSAPVLFEHGVDPVLKNRVIGKANLKKDEFGVWAEAQLQIRDAYEKFIYQLAENDKLGWSSSTAPNLVQRSPVGKAYHIKAWPLGLDASLTTHPAEPRNAAMTLKAYVDSLQPAEQPAPNGAENPSTEPVSVPVPVQPVLETKMETVEAPNEVMAKLDALMAEVTAMKTAPVERTPGVAGKTAEMLAAEQAPAFNKGPKETLADEQVAAMKSFLNSELGEAARAEWKSHNAKLAADREQQAAAAAFKHYLHNPDDRDARLTYERAAKATLIEGTASLGGNLVPSLYGNQIIGALKEESILRRAGSYQFSVMGTNSFNVPTITRSASAPLVTEKTISAQAEPTFGNVAFVPYAYRSLYIASREVVTDTRIPLEQILVDNAQWQLTQSENNHFAVGSGTTQPQGFAAAASVLTSLSPGSTLALAFATPDYILDTYHSLPYQYRPTAAWFANDATIKQLRKIKWATTSGAASTTVYNDYMWQPGLQGNPDTLLGRPIYPLNTMSTTGSTANVLVFGDPRFFWIADFNNGGLDFQVLNELYAASMSVGYTFWKRIDSHLMVSEAAVGLRLVS